MNKLSTKKLYGVNSFAMMVRVEWRNENLKSSLEVLICVKINISLSTQFLIKSS